ncbi:tetratricopeptide repeat protein [Tautonia sociabilis]|uniref:Tetratricopeptide repeat protein n=1 Tax=Tautonia sociabilis TaxID=2080755 RepID=A0A432MFQ3_9BACT|nr:tetratricopeptide repeat protein [Tautonia sociabilis]RUL85259.1 tetratricopeptide repeat protein [Tautonia sociabilis]
MSSPENVGDTPEIDVIVEATREGFERQVIERSKSVPVVVDFWAEWCGPCRMLGPVLEKLAREYHGAFVLVKADTEQLGDIAAAFGVQGIPAVFGLRDGQIVDAFVGVQSEAMIRQWLDRLLPSPAQRLAAEAAALEASDPAAAEARYREAIERDPREAKARIGLARVLEAQGQQEEARQQIAELERRGFLEPEAEAVKARLALDAAAADAGDLAAARAEAEAKPDDLLARFKLAEALAAAGQHEEALAICLDLVERDRQGVGEQARQTMLAIFNLLPPDDPVAVDYRRKLSFVL